MIYAWLLSQQLYLKCGKRYVCGNRYFVATRLIDAVLYGTDIGTGKMLFIMSQKSQEISQAIISQMSRGVTILKSKGAFIRAKRVMCCFVRFVNMRYIA